MNLDYRSVVVGLIIGFGLCDYSKRLYDAHKHNKTTRRLVRESESIINAESKRTTKPLSSLRKNVEVK